MAKTSDALIRRLEQVEKILDLSKTTHRGRAARDEGEVTAWLKSAEGKAALAPHRSKGLRTG